jgi:ubiquinone/menaquinone biosynthesis C-methylase UbiE
MYPEALAYLTCPTAPALPLALEPGAQRAPDGAIERGWLRSPAGARYPIRNGIADLLGAAARPDSPAQVANYVAPTAWAYERIWRPRALTILSGEPFGYDRELPLITGLAAPSRGGLIVDVACSNGLYARALEQARVGAPGHVIGIDHAMPMLLQARAYAQQAGLRISYVRARAQALPFAAGSANVLAMGGSLNEIGDAEAALRELTRTLAPAGRVVLMSLVRAERPAGMALQQFLGLGGIAFWPLDQLNRRFAAAGLRLRAQWRYGVVVFSALTHRNKAAGGTQQAAG